LFLFWRSIDTTTTPATTTDTSVKQVSQGGTGATNLAGYLRGNGTNPITAVQQIPYTDIQGAPSNRSYGSQVDALDNASGTGIYALTAYGASTVRTMTGTSNRLSVSNGDGVSANPTFDIDSAYVGQNTITTLGTITTGTWNAGAVTSTAFNGPLGGTTPNVVTGTSVTISSGTNNRVVNNLLLKRDTTDATITELTTDGAAGSGATNRIAVPTNAAMSVVINICAKVSGSANSKQMLRQFLITNTAGTTTIEGAVTVLGTDLGSAALAAATTTITANDTDDCIKVEVTGVAATNIRWTAYIVSTETTYT
jgi:hypothetical protein